MLIFLPFSCFKKVSRQEYLKKMEQKKLKELRDDIEDEQYLFDGVKLTEAEYGELSVLGPPLHKCNAHLQAMNWGSCVDWLSGQFSSHSLATSAKKLMLTCTIYCIWQKRNARLFSSVCTSANVVVRKVESMVRCKLLSVNNFKEDGDND
ncbi:Pre-mRNA-splicing factor ATP-dependent RNA helicase DEAH1 [Camellia lanceoleosa]|uniref:Pre-mRNA-splicing factor ATP-dependent RNA helicase DEAH1 n=1 Tax=Camellia lanceoleosa TaxID=1840588 RepID=A0ACC0FGJ7_9ERIC|nr:Pre-mRNA-splicing factor ATP-dependent RNA helicase DEAH1 [Camellia lanceoleosa]